MKTLTKVCIGIALIFYAAVAMAGQTQHIVPGEVPEGITAEDWGIVQEAYLKASNTGEEDSFGYPVAISDDLIVAGAHAEASSATGIDGNQSDNSALLAGAAYIFARDGTSWSQQAYLKGSNTESWDQFGYSVAVSGETIVIGAKNESSNATGVNGDESDNSVSTSGAAYVFVRNGTTWSQQAYLKASNTGEWDGFGSSVAISGDTIVIGAWSESSNATGVNGNQSDNSALYSGAAYVFVRNGTSWSQQAYLKASNTDSDDGFGTKVALSGDTIVVGAHKERSNATGVDGNQADNSLDRAGAAYVFARSGTTWSQQAYLKASNTGQWDDFSSSVSISGDTIVIGAREEESGATGVNGNQTDNNAISSGAAYVFIRSGTTWSQQAYLKAFNTDRGDHFGCSVAISGNTIIIGARVEDSNATGVNGNMTDNSMSGAGAAYIYTRSGTIWSGQDYLKASNTASGDYFGGNVAISGDSVVVGAEDESSSATGVNGNQSDNSVNSAGAAYVFTGIGSGNNAAVITECGSVPTGVRIEWIPVAGWDSVLKCSTDLVNIPFTDLTAALPYPVNSYTDTVVNGKCYYRVDLQP